MTNACAAPSLIPEGVFAPGTHEGVEFLLRFCAAILFIAGALLLILAIIACQQWPIVALMGSSDVPYPIFMIGLGFVCGIGSLVGYLRLNDRIPVWMRHRWPARCPACGKAMDYRIVRWDPDSPILEDNNYYREYACRACDFRHNNSWMKWVVDEPPVWQPWPLPDPGPPERLRFTDILKGTFFVGVVSGLAYGLKWLGTFLD